MFVLSDSQLLLFYSRASGSTSPFNGKNQERIKSMSVHDDIYQLSNLGDWFDARCNPSNEYRMALIFDFLKQIVFWFDFRSNRTRLASVFGNQDGTKIGEKPKT